MSRAGPGPGAALASLASPSARVIIDEADATLDVPPRRRPRLRRVSEGLGVLRALLSRAHRRDGAQPVAEDLAASRLALLQGLAVVSALGLPHVERNGHHYFRAGHLSADERSQLARRHPDLAPSEAHLRIGRELSWAPSIDTASGRISSPPLRGRVAARKFSSRIPSNRRGVRAHVEELGLDIPLDEDLEGAGAARRPSSGPRLRLRQPLQCTRWAGTAPRTAAPASCPAPLATLGRSGAAMIWGGEAAAVRADGRANPHQLTYTAGRQARAAEGLAALREEVLEGRREIDVAEDIGAIGFSSPSAAGRPAEPPAP